MSTILVIDDNDSYRAMLTMFLTEKEFMVIQADNGKSGWKLLHNQKPNLVILDIVMPDQEGIETLIQLRKEYPRLPVIAISGGGKIGPDNYLKLAKAFGADETFEKPVSNTVLLSAIRTLLEP
ncbi:response regulator [Sediminispirochaeta smaragdinae]|jgi:DNA-binding response OmpR family regulator|uniref:Response regulator receiver protein n=1 Tax=Sediminispirochaeta smaragdinae (strain DSM 11293 / JCM 15392 / SEBR 4228) TaxID=573413 RepID=E1R716_SEDSS|nr:response regulator [Sediminispirochaeta smaragdinae]ADK81343.1 response regulator receiver protein [Sediminispirochaeta smaragdinae DSM 11293]